MSKNKLTLDENMFSNYLEKQVDIGNANVEHPIGDPITTIPHMHAARWKTLESRANQIKSAFESQDKVVGEFLEKNNDRTPRKIMNKVAKKPFKKMGLDESLFSDRLQEAIKLQDCDFDITFGSTEECDKAKELLEKNGYNVNYFIDLYDPNAEDIEEASRTLEVRMDIPFGQYEQGMDTLRDLLDMFNIESIDYSETGYTYMTDSLHKDGAITPITESKNENSSVILTEGKSEEFFTIKSSGTPDIKAYKVKKASGLIKKLNALYGIDVENKQFDGLDTVGINKIIVKKFTSTEDNMPQLVYLLEKDENGNWVETENHIAELVAAQNVPHMTLWEQLYYELTNYLSLSNASKLKAVYQRVPKSPDRYPIEDYDDSGDGANSEIGIVDNTFVITLPLRGFLDQGSVGKKVRESLDKKLNFLQAVADAYAPDGITVSPNPVKQEDKFPTVVSCQPKNKYYYVIFTLPQSAMDEYERAYENGTLIDD